MIDFHVHLGNLYRHGRPPRAALSAHQLIERMNREGIDKSVLLPLESPEGAAGYFLTEDAIAARDLYPERLIAFVSVDPRQPHAAEQIDVFVKREGCRGFGELINGLAFDDERNKMVYAKCDEYGLPLVFEINATYCYDDPQLSRLEACLWEFPNCMFCGHGPGFWAAISGDNDGCERGSVRGQGGYPTGPVMPGGAMDRLLAECANLYADLSAHSGYNALTRDPEFTQGFVDRHWRKLLFATDYMGPDQPLPQVEWLAALDVASEVRQAIGSGNARRLLGLG